MAPVLRSTRPNGATHAKRETCPLRCAFFTMGAQRAASWYGPLGHTIDVMGELAAAVSRHVVGARNPQLLDYEHTTIVHAKSHVSFHCIITDVSQAQSSSCALKRGSERCYRIL
jgi:hypothetical protein